MRFGPGPIRRPSPTRVRDAVFAVGGQAYVAGSQDLVGRVVLTDDANANVVATVTDGTQVEILAWRPRGSGGTRYRVRSTGNGLEGWIPVGNLRSARSAVSPAIVKSPPPTRPPVQRASESGASKRRFAQR